MNVHAIGLLALAGVALVGIIVLAALGQSIPDVLSGVALAAVGGAGGASLPARTRTGGN